MRTLSISLSLLIFVGCGSAAIEGTIMNESGGPVADMTVSLTAIEEVGLTCQKFGATTDADGKFSIEGPCVSQTEYAVKLSDDSLWLPEGGTLAKNHTGPVDLKVVYTGGAEGVFHAKNKMEVGGLRTSSDLKTTTHGETTVLYTMSASKTVVIPTGEWILVNGLQKSKDFTFHTLKWAPGPHKLGAGDDAFEIGEESGLWVVGGDLTADGFTATPVTLDASKVTTKAGGDIALTYIAGDALPEGRYAYFTEGARRPYLFDFGKALPE